MLLGDERSAIKIALLPNESGYNTHRFTNFGPMMVFRYSGKLTAIENESILGQFEGECIVRLGSTVWLNGAATFQMTEKGIRASTAYGSTSHGNLKGTIGGSVAALAMNWGAVEEASIYGYGSSQKRNMVSVTDDKGFSELEVRVRAWTINGKRKKRIKDALFLVHYMADKIAATQNLDSNQVIWSNDADGRSVSFAHE